MSTPEEYDKALTSEVDKALEKLSEHFECCLILATNTLPGDKHSTFSVCTGNRYAAIGMAQIFLERQRARVMAEIIREAKDEE